MSLLEIFGAASLSVDFGKNALAGSVAALKFTNMEWADTQLNDIGFTATLDRTVNLFAGTTRATTAPGGFSALEASATGDVAGRFFGPAANEAGGVLTLSDGARRIIGSFGTKQQ